MRKRMYMYIYIYLWKVVDNKYSFFTIRDLINARLIKNHRLNKYSMKIA